MISAKFLNKVQRKLKRYRVAVIRMTPIAVVIIPKGMLTNGQTTEGKLIKGKMKGPARKPSPIPNRLAITENTITPKGNLMKR